MKLTGPPDQIIDEVAKTHPEIHTVLAAANGSVRHRRRSIEDFQAAALYVWTRPYNKPGAHILEIGSAYGYSLSIMALACPLAETITGMVPAEKTWERDAANGHLLDLELKNACVLGMKSWDYLADTPDTDRYDVVFVDGDHNRVKRDLPWFNRLNTGGAMIFHDYTPGGAPERPCEPVYQAVHEMAKVLGRMPDLLCIKDNGLGMAGFYRYHEETWDG